MRKEIEAMGNQLYVRAKRETYSKGIANQKPGIDLF